VQPYENPQLSDEESWDIAAYVESLRQTIEDLSQIGPIFHKNGRSSFWTFSGRLIQHKFGPFKPIKETKKINDFKTKL
jgi:thiosulfate dehydrogenase